jgi:hypothetical protein
MSTIELPVLILNPHVPLARAAEPPGPEVNVPDPVAISSRIAATISSERGIGRTPGPTRALLEPRRPLPQVAVDPLVASLPRDAVELAQLGDRKRVAKVFRNEDPCWQINGHDTFASYCPWCGTKLPDHPFSSG